MKRQRLSKRARISLASGVVVLVLGGGGAAVVLKLSHDSAVAKQHREEKAHAEEVAAEQRTQAEIKEQTEEASRKELESSLEKNIQKDAEKRVREGDLEGPILGASCTPSGGGNAHDLSSTSGTYDCIAITKRESDGESSGYRFTATVNFASGEYSWRLGG